MSEKQPISVDLTSKWKISLSDAEFVERKANQVFEHILFMKDIEGQKVVSALVDLLLRFNRGEYSPENYKAKPMSKAERLMEGPRAIRRVTTLDVPAPNGYTAMGMPVAQNPQPAQQNGMVGLPAGVVPPEATNEAEQQARFRIETLNRRADRAREAVTQAVIGGWNTQWPGIPLTMAPASPVERCNGVLHYNIAERLYRCDDCSYLLTRQMGRELPLEMRQQAVMRGGHMRTLITPTNADQVQNLLILDQVPAVAVPDPNIYRDVQAALLGHAIPAPTASPRRTYQQRGLDHVSAADTVTPQHPTNGVVPNANDPNAQTDF